MSTHFQEPRGPDAERRRQHVRRRITAALVLGLVVVWVLGLTSSGGSHPHAVARSSHRAALPVPSFSARLAGEAAEDAREQRAIQSVLATTPYVTVGGSEKREIALTFDDGPGPFTPQVLDVLERLHVPATFFIVGRELRYFGSYLPRELAHGFAIGDHTQDHEPMALLSRSDQSRQLLEQAAAIARLGAPFPHLFRPPYGSFDATTLAIARHLRMLTVMWTVDTADFRQPGVKAIERAALSGARPGAIILLHDAGGQREQTIAALPKIVHGLRRRGFDLVTVPRLLADDPPQAAHQAPPSSLSGG